MKKIFYSIVVLSGLAVYAFAQNQNISSTTSQTLQSNAASNALTLINTPATTTTMAQTSTSSVTSSAATNSTPKNTVQPTVPPKPTISSIYKDGTFTGSVENASYGNIQVAAIISGGKLSNVQILQYPSDRRNSISVNSQALPILISEAIQSQNANVNVVSGATHSSEAFVLSLQSALTQAKN